MADDTTNLGKLVLRNRVSRFLNEGARLRAPLLAALRRLTDKGLPAVLFGGALRDLMVRGCSATPRDVDVVVDAPIEDLTKVFNDLVIRRTRFGGLHLNAGGWMIDVWPLSETWAFRHLGCGNRDFEALTRTTFLNVEAITIDLHKRSRGRQVYASGFFEAVKTRTLDINLEANPFEGLSAVRALITASTLNYALSKRLAIYVAHHLKKTPFEELLEIQISHYGWVRCDVDLMHRWAKIIREQLAVASVIRVPFPQHSQMNLWHESGERSH